MNSPNYGADLNAGSLVRPTRTYVGSREYP
jgi:hypothetical protein